MARACEGCDDATPGIRPESTPNVRIDKVPDGYVIVERCDYCQKYDNDLEAAKAYGSDAHWQTGNDPTDMQAICRPN